MTAPYFVYLQDGSIQKVEDPGRAARIGIGCCVEFHSALQEAALKRAIGKIVSEDMDRGVGFAAVTLVLNTNGPA